MEVDSVPFFWSDEGQWSTAPYSQLTGPTAECGYHTSVLMNVRGVKGPKPSPTKVREIMNSRLGSCVSCGVALDWAPTEAMVCGSPKCLIGLEEIMGGKYVETQATSESYVVAFH